MPNSKPTPLFRKNAIDSKRERLQGDILLVPLLSYSLIVIALLGWLLIVVIWLLSSRFSQKETVQGWLDPPSGVVRIFPQQTGGEIDSLVVQEGDRVKQGQSLVVIKATRMLADGSTLTAELLKEYELQKETILRRLERGDLITASRQSGLLSRVDSARAELSLIDQQVSNVIERDALLETQAANASTLQASGFVSASEVESFQAQKLILLESLQELRRSRVQQQNLINQYQTDLFLIPQEAANTKDTLKDRLSMISQQIAQLKGQQSYTIVAPRSGIVNNIQVVEGQQLKPDPTIPLMSILPEDSTLTAQLMIPVRSVGFVEEQQLFTIRYDAFPYQKFGMHSGTIQTISKTLLLPHEVLNAPIVINGPVYRVIGTLKNPGVQAYGKIFALKSGMTLSADIKVAERSLIEWIFEPLLSLKGRI